MSEAHSGIHPLAPHHIPGYITHADGSDMLFTVVTVCLVIGMVLIGVAYFKLHSLPEHLGDKYNSTQLQLISVLTVLALFTHNNAFWVLALLIAVVRLPDFVTPLQTMADSLRKLSEDMEHIKAKTEGVSRQRGEAQENVPENLKEEVNVAASAEADKGGPDNA